MTDAIRAEAFETHRARLLNIAYRMLGSAHDAEDMVQETYLRWSSTTEPISTPKAWLNQTLVNLCIDFCRSARHKREHYIGPWLPEPIATDGSDPVGNALEVAQHLSIALLATLERLNPFERAAFLLRESFDYSYREISAILDLTESNCRQVVHRAKAQVKQDRPRFKIEPDQQTQLHQSFSQAVETGDMHALLDLFEADITLWSDGGGKVKAALKPIYGADKVARFLLGVRHKWPTPAETLYGNINGEPCGILHSNGLVLSVIALDFGDTGRLRGIYVIRNPDKLKHVMAIP